MPVVLYWQAISHPSRAARKMLDLKGAEYAVVKVLPLNQRAHLRLAGFRGGTVPALKLDGRKIQGSRQISRALDERWPDPPLFPADPELRRRVEEAERWGDEEFQPIPRRLFRFGVARFPKLQRGRSAARGSPHPPWWRWRCSRSSGTTRGRSRPMAAGRRKPVCPPISWRFRGCWIASTSSWRRTP